MKIFENNSPSAERSIGVRKALLVGGALASLTMGSSPLWAQARDGANSTPADSNEGPAANDDAIITVTAQRRSERLQDVPVSVSVVTAEKLQQANISTLEDITVRVPGVSVTTAPISDFLKIRGIGSSLNGGFEQSVGTFVDGVYRGRSRSVRSATFDVEQVEILKGPQTSFFGNNAIAGAFNITTRKPKDYLEANVGGVYAPATKEYNAEAGISVPVTDQLSFRLAGRLSGMDGYVRNNNLGRNEPRLRSEMGRASLAWQPNDAISVQARLDVGRNRDRGVYSAQLIDCPAPATFGAPIGVCSRFLANNGGVIDDKLDYNSDANDSYLNFDFVEAAVTTTIEAGSHTVVLTSGFYDHDSNLFNDFIPVPGPSASVNAGSNAFPNQYLEGFTSYSQEARIQSSTDGPIQYMAGIYYEHTELDLNSFIGYNFVPFGGLAPQFFTATTPIAIQVFNTQTSNTMSGFGTLSWDITPELRLNGGLRFTNVDKRAARSVALGTMSGSSFEQQNFVAATPAAQAAVLRFIPVALGDFSKPSRSDNALMPSAGIQYDITPSTMAYFSYTRGFKAGGFSTLVAKDLFDPESVDAFELGLKGSAIGQRLTYSIIGFVQDYANLQETTTILLPNGSTSQIVGNVAGSQSKGVEIGVSFRPSRNLTISADFAYLDAKYVDYANAPCTVTQSIGNPACSQDLSGKRRDFAPKYSGSFEVNYTQPLNEDLDLKFSVSPYFKSRFFQQPIADDVLAQSGYVKVDGRIGLASHDGWELAIIGKNLTDRTTANFRQVVPTSPGSVQALVDAPRTVAFQFSWRY